MQRLELSGQDLAMGVELDGVGDEPGGRVGLASVLGRGGPSRSDVTVLTPNNTTPADPRFAWRWMRGDAPFGGTVGDEHQTLGNERFYWEASPDVEDAVERVLPGVRALRGMASNLAFAGAITPTKENPDHPRAQALRDVAELLEMMSETIKGMSRNVKRMMAKGDS